MKTITPMELRGLLATQSGQLLLDVRTPVEFAQFHVPEARNEPLDSLRIEPPTNWGGSPNGKPVFLLCATGKRAAQAAEQLDSAGWNPIVVAGGTKGWIDAGFPVTHEPAPPISLERQVRIAAGALVLTGVLLGWFVHPAFYGLAGFVGAGLVFAGITDFCGMALLLAKLPWNSRKVG
jgi:rhodanese-related sulfurtransferase